MILMKAAVVLALLLGVITPPGVWPGSTDTSQGKGAASAAMSSPTGALCQLVRDSAQTGKTCAGGWLPALPPAASTAIAVDSDHPIAHASLLHAIAIDCPPLSPRPPPSC
jgi:hypothetical protein